MKKFLLFSLALLSLAACKKDVEPEVVPDQIKIEPLITRATEVNFEEGDKIGVYVVKVNDGSYYAENKCFTFSGGVFTSDLNWYSDAYSESYIYAYYPYDEKGLPESFSVQTDQTAGIESSDLMAAKKEGVYPQAGAVTMIFKHFMTKIIVKIDNQTGEEISEVVLKNSIPTAKLTEDSLSPDETVAAADIKAYKKAESEYNAIIVPQTVALKLGVSFENTIMSQPLASMELKPGGQYTIEVRALKDGLKVTASGEIENWTDEGNIGTGGDSEVEDKPVSFTEYDGYFEYDGVEYKTITLDDGNTWMAENLRFVPRGMTVSSDAAEDAGIWYPAANAEKTADPALAESLGLLYDTATALGVESLTAENAATLEGTQGICPTGWHIPTAAEMTGLVGHCSNSDLINAEAPYYDATIKGASIAALKEAGWEWTFAGARNKTNTTAKGSYLVTNFTDADGNITYGAMTYLLGSTWYQTTTNDDGSIKNIQYYYMMSTYNKSNEKVTVAYGNFLSGASVRCVKNK